MEYTDVSMALYTSEIARRDAMIYGLEGMIKELVNMFVDPPTHYNEFPSSKDWICIIAAAPTDDPLKLHNVILMAMTMRMADKLEVEDASDPNLS
jgi:hypothetical protein